MWPWVCKSCINRWYQVSRKKTCPLCRQTEEEDDNIYFYDNDDDYVGNDVANDVNNDVGNVSNPEYNIQVEIDNFAPVDNNREDNIYTCFISQDERHDLNFTVERQLENFPIREDSLNLIINEDNTNCLINAHPNTLKMLLDNNIDISIYLKIRSNEQTCVQIKMNLDEIYRDGKIYVNLNLKLDEELDLVIHEINIAKEKGNIGIEKLYAHYVTHMRGCDERTNFELIYSQSLIKKSFIFSSISREKNYDSVIEYKEIDLKIELNNENTILKPGLLLVNFNDGRWEIKTLSETCEFILTNIKIIHFNIKIPSNLPKKNILVDLFSAKSKIINSNSIDIFIGEYEKDEEFKVYNIVLSSRNDIYGAEINSSIYTENLNLTRPELYGQLVYRRPNIIEEVTNP